MKIIGIACSPRQQGNTEFLVQEALATAKEAGADQTELISLANKKILPCDACDCCLETGECIIDDDMQEIYPKLLAADGIIIGTPVYMWGICGLAKIFIDRTYCLTAGHRAIISNSEARSKTKSHRKDLRNKVGGIIVVTARVGGTTVVNQISDFFRLHRMVEAGAAIALAHHKGDAAKDEQGLREARWTGRAVARDIKQRQMLGR